ncbi:precorrin-6A synthase (deacetylating) [Actinophytocola xanthii]|uniref:Precorrin-6A synthase (Deacetylating) n=1 Tax=Actinophytocola xanthii TaxID=1912961 RepID=A0A1Q8CY74_9PSEU|nr:precorrin-6A synthase (deacetylating) [Actinophytocola xanthii]OLF19304.1 precorrin-6A synthase (deacetylating) [Actinophytocola xanthii]
MTRRLVLIGVGPGGPDQVTVEAVRAMNEVDFVVVTEKRRPGGDPLAAARAELLARHAADVPEVVLVQDAERDRTPSGTADPADYRRAVAEWHAARADRYAAALSTRDGDAGFLVWGDPALYDSTIRVLERVADAVGATLEVVPGVSSLSLLAARHRIVPHGVGEPLHVTTGRLLPDAVAQGHPNIAVLLNRSLDELRAVDPAGWLVWWGANLATPSERLVSGPLADVLPEIEATRAAARHEAGWLMDVYLLRRDR